MCWIKSRGGISPSTISFKQYFFCHSVSFDIPTSRSTRVTRPLIVKSKLLFTLSERFWKRQNETVSRMLHFAASHTQTHWRAHTCRIYGWKRWKREKFCGFVCQLSRMCCACLWIYMTWLSWVVVAVVVVAAGRLPVRFRCVFDSCYPVILFSSVNTCFIVIVRCVRYFVFHNKKNTYDFIISTSL